MNNLTELASGIDRFEHLSPSEHIDLFAYYLTKIKKQDGFNAGDIKECFDKLNLPPYSNIPQYLRRGVIKNGNKKGKFFLKKESFYVTPYLSEVISKSYLNIPHKIVPTSKLISLEIFEDTRSYVKEIAIESAASYDTQLYNACSVLLRRLLETLIIEAFERRGISDKIKDRNGNFLYLKDLLEKYGSESMFNASRNSKSGIKALKIFGDLSAHNRRYLAKKSDIDKVKPDLRIVMQELINIIDYPSWK